MIGKKINQLATELSPLATDLTIIGDPTTGVSKKITLEQISSLFGGSVSFYTNYASFPAVGNIDIIYCAKDTNKLYLWSGSAYTEVFPSQALLDTYQLRSEKGNANGYASLDSLGKVPISQLPSSLMEYKGTWNAATNTPTLANGTGDTGDVYICNVAGTVNFGAGPLTFAVGDYVIYSGTIWQRSSGAVGTVTSVAASITGDAIGITGSPVTTSGTLAFAFGGNSTQYINGAGNLVTFPGVINEAQNLITEVYNKTGATLTKGTVVYINGGQGNLPTVTKALATGDATSAQTYGIVRNNITNNNNGYVVVAGRISDLDTQAYTEGTQLYLSPTTAGTYTSTKPYAPNHLVYVGIVVRAHPTQGVVEVKIQNGYEMDELHNVAAQSPDNNDILQYKTATSLWTKVAGTTSNIAEGSNLYYTDARSRAALSFTAGSGAYNSSTGVITIPTNTNQLTNGAAFITLASLSAGAGISYNNTTGVIASTITQYTDAMARASISGGTGISYNSTTGVITNTITQYTDALARAAISLTTTGTSGAATYNSTTGVLNVPQYALDLSGYVPTSRTLTINGTAYDLSANRSWSVGTVTSVGLSAPTGFSVSGTPVTSSGTLALSFASGYSLPSNASQTTWDTAYNRSLTAASVSGTTTKTLTLTKQDGSTLTATWTDDNTDAVTSVFGRTGAVVATSGDYNTSQVTENTNLYFTNARAIASTLTGYTSGAGTISATDTILSAIQKLNGNIGALTTGVSSVNGLTGAVTLTTSNIAEGTNLYYTEARVSANTNVAANTAARHNAVTLGTANGLSLSTQVLSLALASGSTTGALSSTDWTTFNNKQSALTNPVTGTGTTNYLPKFTGTSTIGNSQIFDNGTNVGINTASPSYKLDVLNGSDFDIRLRDTSLGGTVGILFETANDFSGTSQAYIKGIGSGNSGRSQLIFGTATNVGDTSASEKMRLDASGNLGLGVTPSAWVSTSKGLQIGVDSPIVSLSQQSNGATNLGTNIFEYAANAYKYVASAFALKYDLNPNNGVHSWLTAPSGTAGNAISFTQAMTLNASGNLSIGNTNDSYRLDVQGGADLLKINRTSVRAYGFQISSGGTFTLYDINANADRFTIASTGAATFSSSVDALNLRAYSGGSLFLRNPANTFDWALYQDSSNNLKVDFNGATRLTLNSGGAATFSSSVTASGKGIFETNTTVGNDGTYTGYASVGLGGTTNGFNRVFGGVGTNDGLFLASATGRGIYFRAGGGTTDHVSIISSGNVGIGSTSPNRKLVIQGTYTSNEQLLYLKQGDDNGFSFNLDASVTGNLLIKGVNSGTETSSLLTIRRDNGNVGINTSSPARLLDVNGTMRIADGSAIEWGGVSAAISGTSASNTLLFSTSSAERMRITSGGTLLIGTTTEGFLGKLQVAGSVAITGQYNTVLPSTSFSYFDGSGQVVSSSSSASSLYLDTTWNTTGNPDAIFLNVTNTASGASSKLLNLKVGSVSQFSVSKAGAIQTTAPSSGSAHAWKLGSYAAGGTGTATGVIYIEVNGQIYSIPALLGTP